MVNKLFYRIFESLMADMNTQAAISVNFEKSNDLKPDEIAIKILIERMETGSFLERYWAAIYLEREYGVARGDEILEELIDGKGREAMIAEVARIQGKKHPKIKKDMMGLIDKEDLLLRTEAAFAMIDRQNKKAIDFLLKLTKQEVEQVCNLLSRRRAYQKLVQFSLDKSEILEVSLSAISTDGKIGVGKFAISMEGVSANDPRLADALVSLLGEEKTYSEITGLRHDEAALKLLYELYGCGALGIIIAAAFDGKIPYGIACDAREKLDEMLPKDNGVVKVTKKRDDPEFSKISILKGGERGAVRVKVY